jgi:hypothetical protein
MYSEYNAKTLGSHLKIVYYYFMILNTGITRGHSWSLVCTFRQDPLRTHVVITESAVTGCNCM